MLENFKNGYEVSTKSTKAKQEKNDCVVRAIANVFEISYNTAHEFVAEKFKRKEKKGTFNTRSILKGMKKVQFPIEEGTQLSLFQPTNEKEFQVKWIGDQPKDGGKLINPKYNWNGAPKVAFSVKEFAQHFKRGTYVLLVKKHALTVKDGVIIDNPDKKFTGYRRPVQSAFKVIEK
jgi:hypothetical protein